MTEARKNTRRLTVAEAFTLVELLVVIAIIGILIAIFSQFSGGSREAARRCMCSNNLKQIGVALHAYHDEFGCFPPAYVTDEDGKPMHGWRVLILPYMEQQPLYDQYDFNEPWDGPNNSLLHDTIVHTYSCPSDVSRGTTMTSYLAVVGPDTVFPKDQSTTLGDVSDDHGATLLVVETAASDIHWMEPRDLDVDQMSSVVNPDEDRPQGVSSMHPGGANVVRVDGSIRFLSDDLSAKTLRGMLTIAGGEAINSNE